MFIVVLEKYWCVPCDSRYIRVQEVADKMKDSIRNDTKNKNLNKAGNTLDMVNSVVDIVNSFKG